MSVNITLPQYEKQGVTTLTMIQIGAFASIPPIMVGYILARQHGLYNSIINIVLGNIVILLISLPIGMKAACENKTTTNQVALILGGKGNIISMFGLVVLLTGWFAINLNLISKTICNVIHLYISDNIGCLSSYINLVIGIIIMYIVTHGITALKKFSKISAILFFVTVVCALVNAIIQNGTSGFLNIEFNSNNLIIADALFLIIACPIGMVFDLPTFHRFAYSKLHSCFSNILIFLFFLPLVEIIGALLYVLSNQADIISFFINPAIDRYLLIWNVIFIFFSVCSINNVNLYVSAVNSETIFKRLNFKYRTYLIGSIATLLSLLEVVDNFDKFLHKIAIVISSVLSLLFLRSVTAKAVNMKTANIAVSFGILIGILTSTLITFKFNYPYINAGLCTIVCYLIISLTRKDHD